MSLSAAINAAVSALNAQSSALALVSTNLANSSTTGYKASDASFASLLAGDSTSSGGAGGVSVSTVSGISTQGLLTSSTVATNVAISGNGMFAVADSADSNQLYYTRNGSFSIDSDGYLISNGYYLQGWPTDADGNVIGGTTASNLEAVDTNAVSSIAGATSLVEMSATLPAEAAVGDTFTSEFEIYDSLGTASIVSVTWTKTAQNEWNATFADPVLASDTSQTIGDVTSTAITISFNGDGTLAGTNPSPPTLEISDWATGAADSAIALDMGDAGTATGLSQYASGKDAPSVSLKTVQDGLAYGSLKSINVGDDGTVYAAYSNGEQRAIYKIAVATFPNVDGLSAMTGGIYAQSSESGVATYKISGVDGAGTIYGGQLEASTTDTNVEFSRMMAAQQAYSGAAQAMSAANDMYDTLMSAIR
jgi:flagellar hook protein FlgE